MSKPVRGRMHDDGYVGYNGLLEAGTITILPHSDGKVGEFDPWMACHERDVPPHIRDALLKKWQIEVPLNKSGKPQAFYNWLRDRRCTAIAGLFEEEK